MYGYGNDITKILPLHDSSEAFVGVLDSITATTLAAWSVRRLAVANTSPFRMVESGLTEQDAIYDGSNYVDEADITAFDADAKTLKWYDQSGNTVDPLQATFSNCPRLSLAGVLQKSNGKMALDFGLDNIALDGTMVAAAQPFTIYQVVQVFTDTAATRVPLAFDASTAKFPARQAAGGSTLMTFGANLTLSTVSLVNEHLLFKHIVNGATSTIERTTYAGVVTTATGNTGTSGITATVNVGHRTGNFQQWKGKIQEQIILAGVVSGADDTLVKDSIKTFYGFS